MPQLIHFQNEIGLDDLILSFSPKKGGGVGVGIGGVRGRKLKYMFSNRNHSREN